ncbi:hypothetical protein BGZ49_008162 [Haplosporangium sp. Z 27]|nr:hypothetical protein BGZ49_008162 [Haplosporangium sp. Z 27]
MTANLRSGAQLTSDQDGPEIWSWITSHRTVFAPQTHYEMDENIRQPETYSKKIKPSLKKVASIEDLTGIDDDNDNDDSASEKSVVAPLIKAHGGDTTEIEKKNTQIAWEKARMSQAFNLTARDAAAITAITIVAIVVRLWRISWPDEVVEVDVGRLVNRYFTGEYAFDVHPPLGTMIMAGVAALLNYNGTFEFDNIGDLYPSSMPYISMRLVVSLMGALCAPIAYVTLKSSGQSALAAILASFMIVFDNALVTSNRLLGQDATLMFFTAATFMFWTLFSKQCTRPFTLAWWSWLLATGISMTGAMSVKLVGSASVVAIGLFTFSSLASLIMDDSVSMPYQPSNTSPQAEYDLGLLSKPFRQTLILKSHQNTSDLNWSSIVYGSVVQIQNEGLSEVYLHSMHETTPAGSKQQQLGGYHYPDLNTHWIVIRADMEEDDQEEIPSRLQFLKDGDAIRLRHVPTRFCLHSHKVRSYSHKAESALFEVTAYGAHEYDGDENDWWFVETVDPISNENIPVSDTNNEVKALETAFRLKHSKMGCYLFDTSIELPAPWGKGRHEIACRPGAKINPRSIWRFTMNKHDYLPYDTPVAAYPQFTYWQKFLETHKLMWRNVPIVEQIPQPAKLHPIRWPLGQAVIYAWTGHTWQISLITNPVVWGASLVGLLSYLGFRIVFILREKRGYIEKGLVKGELLILVHGAAFWLIAISNQLLILSQF